MAGSGFWAGLKRLFAGSAKKADQERYCMSCRKITGGALSPKAAGEGAPAAMDFTCADCGSHTQVLQ